MAKSTFLTVAKILGRFLMAYIFVGLLLLVHLLFIGERGELYTMARPWHGVLSIVLPILLVALMRAKPLPPKRARLLVVVFGLGLLMIVPTLFTMRAFGTRELAQILLYLAHINLTEATQLLTLEHRREVIEIIAGLGILVALASFLQRRVRCFGVALVGLSGILMANSLPVAFVSMPWIGSAAAAQRIDPESDVVRPVILREPTHKKNLLLIYFESMEEAIAELPATRESFAPLEMLSADGLRLHGLEQYPGSDYSAGGIVATQCGVPLLTPNATSFMPATGERANSLGPVMPTLYCLGDILLERGYRTSFFNGADLSSYGIEMFLRSHGIATIFDLHDFQAAGLTEQRNSWGAEDDVLYERIRQELSELAADDVPFFLAFENIGTHPPDGYLDPTCAPAPTGRQMPTAIRCGVNHITGLIKHVEHLGLAETTVIAIMSDHLMMSSTLNGDFRAHNAPRHNFALILNAGASGAIQRRASMMDIYPTLLEVMGYEIADSRAGMGRSLFSDEPTLAEHLGTEALDAALRLNMPLSRHLWRASPGQDALH